MQRMQLIGLVGALVALGLGIFLFKIMVLDFPLTPDRDADSWTVEAKVSFEGRDAPVSLRLALPSSSAGARIVEEDLIASGFGTDIEGSGENRYAVFERRSQTGRAVLFYRASLYQLDASTRTNGEAEAPEAISDYRRRDRRRAIQENATPLLLALDSILTEALETSADEDSFIAQLAEISSDESDERVESLIDGGPPGLSEQADRMVFLLNAAGTPARVVSGIRLTAETRSVPLERWMEFWIDDGWIPADPETAEPLQLSRIIPITYGGAPVVDGEGFRRPSVSYAIQRNLETQLSRAMRRGAEDAPFLAAISLLNLPIDMQLVFRVLFLIPIAALLIVVLKQVIGIPAFGTFMPVLIALAFRETQLLTGAILFTLIVGAGLVLRVYFAQLKLLLVPRLAAILIVVTFLMAAIALTGEAFNIPLGLSISLFPIVILTMTIERMSTVWEEAGAKDALQKAGGSLLGAAIGYFIITNNFIEEMVFVYPELLLIILAVVILLGRYNGYKLTEFRRFRKLAATVD